MKKQFNTLILVLALGFLSACEKVDIGSASDADSYAGTDQSFSDFLLLDKFADDKWLNLNKSPGYTRYDYRRAKAKDIPGVRLVFTRAWYHENRRHFLDWLNKNIEWAQETDLYIILELNGDLTYEDANLWEDIAGEYALNNRIAAYSIASGEIGNDIALEVFDAIRVIDSKHPIIVSKTDQIDFISSDNLVRIDGWRDASAKSSSYTGRRLVAENRIATDSILEGDSDWAVYTSKKIKIDNEKIVGFIPNIGIRGVASGMVSFDDFIVLEFDENDELVGEIWKETFTKESVNNWWDWVVGLPKSNFKGKRILNDGFSDKASLHLDFNNTNADGFGGWSGDNLWVPIKFGYSYQVKGAMKGEAVQLDNSTLRFELDVYESDDISTPNNTNQPAETKAEEDLDSVETKQSSSEVVEVINENIGLAPVGISKEAMPQFVVLGFDDNWLASGLNWAVKTLEPIRNNDGSKAKASFYMNTLAMNQKNVDPPEAVIAATKNAYKAGHEIGNHTHNHHADINQQIDFRKKLTRFDNFNWQRRIDFCQNDLINLVGIPKEEIQGYRAPYLVYNQAMFEVVKSRGFAYDSSIEEGFHADFDGTNFRWPYRMNQVPPGYKESWAGNKNNPNYVEVGAVGDIWQLPNYALMVPEDSLSEQYDFDKGMWERMQSHMPSLENNKVTGFDYNLWVSTKLNKREVLAILKYNLDLRLQGNKAPYLIGLHSQYYTDDAWVKANDVQATTAEMRETIEEFLQYAVSKKAVKVTSGIELVNWLDKKMPTLKTNKKTLNETVTAAKAENTQLNTQVVTGWVATRFLIKEGHQGISKSNILNIRHLPDVNNGEVLRKLKKDEKVKILFEKGSWSLIRTQE